MTDLRAHKGKGKKTGAKYTAQRSAKLCNAAERKRKNKNSLSEAGTRKKLRADNKRRNRRSSRTAPGIVTALIVVLVLGLFCWRVWRSDYVQMHFVYMWPYQDEILEHAGDNSIDPFLVAAIIKNESNFDHLAVSDAGAVGLMQIMPDSGEWIAGQMGLKDFTVEQLRLPEINIRMGCWYLGELEHEFKRNLALTAAAYNAGRGRTKEWMKNYGWNYEFGDIAAIPYNDTREYVRAVLRDRDAYYLYYRDALKRGKDELRAVDE